jgi:hypothetical protein
VIVAGPSAESATAIFSVQEALTVGTSILCCAFRPRSKRGAVTPITSAMDKTNENVTTLLRRMKPSSGPELAVRVSIYQSG